MAAIAKNKYYEGKSPIKIDIVLKLYATNKGHQSLETIVALRERFYLQRAKMPPVQAKSSFFSF